MKIDIAEVKRLRELTGVGITDAKKALEEAKGDFDKALEEMRVKGLAKADKRGEREARAGIVDSYIHGERIGVLVEINCETDFVARNEEFTSFVHDIAMHIAASNPVCVSAEDAPEELVAKEKELVMAELKESGKPDDMLEKIAEGKMNKFMDQICLLNQPFIKNPDQTVGDYLKERIAKLGENIVIRRFSRIELGGTSD
ncbi:MAG: translation elongation factor Ts [Patescibacteria group bacterium]